MFLTARCLMSLIGSLASTEKMVPEGRRHMRPFQFHLKEHWKIPQPLESSQHFYQFYLKDLTWSDNDNNLYLGPVVAAQQVLDPSPQSSHPRKERKGGGGGGGGAHPLQPSLQESKPRV